MDNVPRYKGYLVRIPKGWGGVALEYARKESLRMGDPPACIMDSREEKALIRSTCTFIRASLNLSTDGMFCEPFCIIVQGPPHPTDLESACHSEKVGNNSLRFILENQC